MHNDAFFDRPIRLLGVWAHPDDEAYLSAGLMRRVVAAGGEVTVVTLTNGEEGFSAEDPRTRAERADQRRREMRAAMEVVGVTDVRFRHWPDGGLADADQRRVAGSIARAIRSVRPDVVVTFGSDGITGHDDHVACSRATTAAWAELGIGELLYAGKTQAWLDEFRTFHDAVGMWMGAGEPAGVGADELVVDLELEGVDLDRKRAVLAAHGSQTDFVAAAMGEERYREWIRGEAFRRPVAAELEGLARPDLSVAAA
ncbi:MAG: PIG-L family deacetylase [Actinomycetota bacterium]